MCQAKIVEARKGYYRMHGSRFLKTSDAQWCIEAYLPETMEEQAQSAYNSLWGDLRKKRTLKQLIEIAESIYDVNIAMEEELKNGEFSHPAFKKVVLTISPNVKSEAWKLRSFINISS